MLSVIASLIIVTYADDDYFGTLPGDVTEETSGRGYPSKLMSEDLHGAAFYAGWTATNGFARFYTIQYNSFSMKGELKHGLWKWTVPGAGDKADIWWCEMGGSWDTTVSSGHTDNEHQQNMDKIWELIRNSDNVNIVGPLAQDAKLLDIAVNVIRMYPNPSTHLWLNRGTSTEPAYRAEYLGEYLGDAEFYYVEHLYGYTDIPLFHGNECDGTNSDDCVNLHDTVIVILRKEITSGLVGLPIFGVHYGNLTTAGACPDTCGAGPCDCDLVLVDVSLDGPLGTSWSENDYFVPHWMLGNDAVDICDGLNWNECVNNCGTCSWVCPVCKECVPAGCSQITAGCDEECSCSCPVSEKCTAVSKGLSETCDGLDVKSCSAECGTCVWTCPTCKVCEGPGSCSDNTRHSQCSADDSCSWMGCEERACIPL